MISLDFETYSELDLKETGVYPYARHASTEVLLMCYTFDEGVTMHTWRRGDLPPLELFEAILNGQSIRAFNAQFETEIWEHVCYAKMDWPYVDPTQWLDTQGLTYSLALPGSLDAVAKALDLPVQKNADGTRLITKFSKPRKPTKTNSSIRNLPEDFPEDFERFAIYCADDVRVECAIYAKIPLKDFMGMEKAVVAQHIRMNRQGIVLDVNGFTLIRRMLDYERERLTKELIELTNGEIQTDGQIAKIVEWAEKQGYKLPGLTKFDVEKVLGLEDVPPKVRRCLEIRQTLGQVSTKKYERMAAVVCQDGTAKGNLVYHRASTGRSGGAGLQMHNFPRDYISNDSKIVDDCIEFIGKEQYEEVATLYGGDLYDVGKGLLRSMITAPPGQLLYVSDFSGVENRGVAWFCRDPVGLKVFEEKRDQYREFAAAQFGITTAQVSAEQRTAAKATILGAIFGSGWKTIYETNVLRGIPMTEAEAQRNVEDFREIYKVTAQTWYDLDRMAQAAVSKRSDQLYKGVKFGVRGDFLFIKLPSGRLLAYHKPKREMVITPWGKEKMAVTYMGLTAQKVWMRLTLTPNRLIENIVSAICRDLLMHSMLVIERDGRVKPVLSVHDEAVSYGEPDAISKHDYEQLMATVPEWAVNDEGVPFPLESEGYIAKRYRK